MGFARYLGALWPVVSENRYLIAPLHITDRYALSLSTAQLVGVLLIALLSWANNRGVRYGRVIQNVFTSAKLGASLGVIVVGVLIGRRAVATHALDFDADGPANTTWTNANCNIANTDIVGWYTLGFHHVTRAEDWPVMPTMWHEFMIRPFHFFQKNPVLDPPKSLSEAATR